MDWRTYKKAKPSDWMKKMESERSQLFEDPRLKN